MAAEGSLGQSMEMAVKRYSSLFKLPSYRRAVLLLALTCIITGLLSACVFVSSIEGILYGITLGFSLFFMNLIFDYVISMLVLNRDPIYDLRRTVALSLFCWILWFFFILVSIVITISFNLMLWVKLCLLGFSAVLILRNVVFFSTSSKNYGRLIVASLLQPISCMIPFLLFLERIGHPMPYSMFLFFIFSPTVGIISTAIFIFLINRVGEKALEIPSLSLFKAFLLNWIADINAPFEELLEKLGENQDVEVSLIKFCSSKPKAIITVPSVHPGPFKNIGSSLLPSLLKTTLEKELNCEVCVPHGLLGHEFDLASQLQNEKIINRIVALANFEVHEEKATPLIKVSNDLATACCQIFGNFAFLSFTLAPKTTEDLPHELGLFVRQEAEKHGLSCCVVVNAHNSIDGRISMKETLDALKKVAAECLEKTVCAKQLPFEVGAATVFPREFKLKDGMGPSGITATVVKVGKQRTVYVVIDGNNMVSGLREKILSNLFSLGIDDGEIFTTDTHAVNGITLNERGYHPLGEAIPHGNLIEHIKKATLAAVASLEHVEAGCRNVKIEDVKVIGAEKLETLCLLIDRTLQTAKRAVVPIFAVSSLLLMLFLILF